MLRSRQRRCRRRGSSRTLMRKGQVKNDHLAIIPAPSSTSASSRMSRSQSTATENNHDAIIAAPSSTSAGSRTSRSQSTGIRSITTSFYKRRSVNGTIIPSIEALDFDPVLPTPPQSQIKTALDVDFPHGFRLIPTSSLGLLCGLHALRASMIQQIPTLPAPAIEDLYRIAINGRGAILLQEIYGHVDQNNFTIDHLGAILMEYGEDHGHILRLAVHRAGNAIMVMPEARPNATRVWVHNDNAGTDATYGHYSGMKKASPDRLMQDQLKLPVLESRFRLSKHPSTSPESLISRSVEEEDWPSSGNESTPQLPSSSRKGSSTGADTLQPASARTSIDGFDQEEPIPRDNNIVEVAARLLELLQGAFQGCGDHAHQLQDQIHEESTETHHDLSATYSTININRIRLGLKGFRFPENENAPRKIYLSGSELQEVFEGLAQDGIPKSICIHAEETEEKNSLMAIDHDSMILFAYSLAAFIGFRWSPLYNKAYGIKTDLHITVPVHIGEGKTKQVMLKDIPHMYLGPLNGAIPGAQVFVFFPRQYQAGGKFIYLSGKTVARWNDEVMQKAIDRVISADIRQHVVPSQRTVHDVAVAGRSEGNGREDGSASKQHYSYSFPDEALDLLWTACQHIIADGRNGLEDFGGAFLVVSAKGFKNSYKDYGTVVGSMDKFAQAVENTFNWQYVDQAHTWVDIGYEVCPTTIPPLDSREAAGLFESTPGHEFGRENTDRHGPQVLMYKSCCLQTQLDEIREEFFDGTQGVAEFYHPGFLKDAANLTLVPTAKSRWRRAGVCFSQWYSSLKELLDALKTFPFSKASQEQLGLDRKLFEALVKQAHRGHAISWKLLVQAYEKSKGRIFNICADSAKKCFGIRTEHRITWQLWIELRRQARLLERNEGHIIPSLLDGRPSHAWSITTESYLAFLQGNYHKMTLAIELAHLTSRNITMEQSKLLISMFRVLKCFATGILDRDLTLWAGRRETSEGTIRGLGWEDTFRAYKYAWFEAGLTDWTSFRFRQPFSTEMLVTTDCLAWYDGASHLIQDTFSIVDSCEELLQQYPSSRTLAFLELLLVHLCLLEYRRNCIISLKGDIKEHLSEAVLADHIQFSYHGLRVPFGHLALVSGNKAGLKEPKAMFKFLWGEGKEWNRQHWNDKPFRALKRRILVILGDFAGARKQFLLLLQQEFHRYHWVIPYPDVSNGCFVDTNKNRERKWYSMKLEKGEWAWARKDFQVGLMPTLPPCLKMPESEIRRHVIGLQNGICASSVEL